MKIMQPRISYECDKNTHTHTHTHTQTLRVSQTELCSLTKRACKMETPAQLLRTSPETAIPSWS